MAHRVEDKLSDWIKKRRKVVHSSSHSNPGTLHKSNHLLGSTVGTHRRKGSDVQARDAAQAAIAIHAGRKSNPKSPENKNELKRGHKFRAMIAAGATARAARAELDKENASQAGFSTASSQGGFSSRRGSSSTDRGGVPSRQGSFSTNQGGFSSRRGSFSTLRREPRATDITRVGSRPIWDEWGPVLASPDYFPKHNRRGEIMDDESFVNFPTSLRDNSPLEPPGQLDPTLTSLKLTLANISRNIMHAALEYPDLGGTHKDDPEGAVDHVLEKYAQLAHERDDTMKDVSSMIFRAAENFPQLKGVPEDDLKGTVVHIIDAYQDMVRAYDSHIDSIPRLIVDASETYPALKAASPTTPYSAVQLLLNTYQSLVQLYWKDKQDVEKFPILESKCLSLEKELKELRSNLSEKSNALEVLNDEKMKQEDQLSNLKRMRDKDLQMNKTVEFESKKMVESLVAAHEAELNELRELHEKELMELRDDQHKIHEEVAVRERANRATVDSLQEELVKATNAHQDMASAINEHDRKMLEMTEKHNKEKRLWESKRRDLILAGKEAEMKLRDEFEAAKESLTEDFEDQTEDLQKEVQDLKEKLDQRENYSKGLLDSELKQGFSEIRSQITDFAREIARPKWKLRENFHFSEEVLEQFSKKTRALKIQLVETSVWLILFDRIFSMPFIVLGRKEAALNRHWRTKSSDSQPLDGVWPDPNKETERRRSELTIHCYKALFSKAGSDSSMKLRSSYSQSVTDIVNKISQSVAGISNLEENEIASLTGLVGEAAKLWLNVCCQRYRLFVNIPEGVIDHLVSKQVPDSLEVLIHPGLTRIGTIQGEDLTYRTTLDGWKTDKKVYVRTQDKIQAESIEAKA